MTAGLCCADIHVIDYHQLNSGDADEQKSLLDACAGKGFFYLHVSHPDLERYSNDAKQLVGFAKDYFGQDLADKLRDTSQDREIFNICGFKPMGLDTGNISQRKDGCEGLRIPSDLFYNDQRDKRLFAPDSARAAWALIEDFTRQSNYIARNILSHLSNALSLETEARFESSHEPCKSSTTTTVLQHYPLEHIETSRISAGHFAHTDTGSITILFTTNWGLQVFDAETETWQYVPPRLDCAVVNIGDTLKFMSGGALTSSLHRVVPTDGAMPVGEREGWKSGSRYSIIYFLRANDDAVLTDYEGKSFTAKDWLRGKFGGYRSSHEQQAQNKMSTWRIGFGGMLEDNRENPRLGEKVKL